MEQQKILSSLRDKKYGGAWSIHDIESVNFIKNLAIKEGDRKKFLIEYKDWIQEGKKFSGLENYKHIDFSAGTTETFMNFYLGHLDKRLRLLKGEYFFHWLVARNYFNNVLVLDHNDITKGDVVVMSCPFSGTGNIPENFYSILDKCETLQVPVMLDMAYINISNIQELNLEYKCIEVICTSLSKVFPVEHNRIGIRLRQNFYDDSLFAYNDNNYVNLQSIHIGHELIKKFKNNWLYDKYKKMQSDECKKLGLDISSCVIFGLDKNDKYPEYKRGNKVNRLCFSRKWDRRIIV